MLVETKQSTAPVTVDDDGVFSGYGSVFGIVDHHKHRIKRGAFAGSLARHAREGTMPVLLWAHHQHLPAGRWLEMREDEIGLLCRGKLNLETNTGRTAYAHLKAGDVTGLSIGFFVVDKKRNSDGTTTLNEIELFETSIVAVPANPVSRITSVKTAINDNEIRTLADRIQRAAATIGKAP